MFSHAIGRFRILAFAEALSWAGLLIGMVFKYLVVENELGVKVFGPIHGIIFILYVLVALTLRQQWDRRTTILALLASIPPFGTVLFERWAAKTGRLADSALATS